MRKAARVDNNHGEVIKALRAIGASVKDLSQLGQGTPDLLVGYRGRNVLLEVKDGSKSPSRQALTKDEQGWHASWGGQVAIVGSAEEAQQVVIRECVGRVG